LEPISSYLVEKNIMAADADELGFVHWEGHRFLSLVGDPKFFETAKNNPFITAVLWDSKNPLPDESFGKQIIPVNSALLAFGELHNSLATSIYFDNNDIHPSAKIHPSAVIAEVGIKIGPNVIIEPFVSIESGTAIGSNSIIRAGVRLGGDALDIKRRSDGTYLMSTHLGKLEIGSNVEIGHNSVVDKALFRHQTTTIGNETKIACLCNISHGVIIGKANKMAAGVKICGSTIVGDENWFGPGVIISHLRNVGSRNYFALGSQVFQDIEDDWKIVGNKVFKDRKLF
jgi:acyl-[acyl carrier protein]--UDP-N-acetylglucosamine O-acyltransferase